MVSTDLRAARRLTADKSEIKDSPKFGSTELILSKKSGDDSLIHNVYKFPQKRGFLKLLSYIYKYARIAKVFGQFSLKVLNDTKKYPLQRILCHFGRINATNGWTDVKVMDLSRYDGFGVIHNRFILQGQKDGRIAIVDILFDVEDHLNYTSVLIVISE